MPMPLSANCRISWSSSMQQCANHTSLPSHSTFLVRQRGSVSAGWLHRLHHLDRKNRFLHAAHSRAPRGSMQNVVSG